MRIGYVEPVGSKQWKCIYFQDNVRIGERLFNCPEKANRFLYEEWMDLTEKKKLYEYPVSNSFAISKF